jgi:hypothetical protein
LLMEYAKAISDKHEMCLAKASSREKCHNQSPEPRREYQYHGLWYRVQDGESVLLDEVDYHLPKLFSAPLDIQHLIIRTAVLPVYYNNVPPWTDWTTSLPLAAEAVSQFISSTQHLTISVNIGLRTCSDLAEIDLSPLATLGSASLSIPHIDLYVHTGILSSARTLAELTLLLEDHEDIMRSINQGVLVIHSEKKPGVL